jgi:hypothetical protein
MVGRQMNWIRLFASFGLGALEFSTPHRRLCSLSAQVVALWRDLVE